MSTATVQQISQNLPTWLGLVRHGETVAITEHGEIIAQLGPPAETASVQASGSKSMAEWMDLQDRRMQSIFGEKIVSDSSPLLDEMRSDRE